MERKIEMETIYGQVIPKANNYVAVNNGHGGQRLVKNDTMHQYEKSFSLQCRKYRNKRIATEFRLYCVVYQRSKRFDLDNSIKTILDCLQYVGAITDDNLCVEIVAKKRVDKANPRVEYGLQEVVTEQSLFELHDSYNRR